MERIEAPALVIHGADDVIIPVENGRRLAERLPNAEYVELADHGHNLPLEDPIDLRRVGAPIPEQVSVYRTPEECFRDLPGYAFEPNYVEQDGLRMHYLDEGAGDPVLLLHGEPTWSFLYRKAIPPIAAVGPRRRARLLRLRPLGQAGRARLVHVRPPLRIDRALRRRARSARPDGRRPRLGRADRPPPRRRAARARGPARVTNTGLYAGRPPSDEWLRFRAFVRRVGTELRPGQLVQITCVTELSDEVVAGYDAPYPAPERRPALVMFPELVPTEPEHPRRRRCSQVREALRDWHKPALVLFSDSDPIFSPRVGERFAELIPGAEPASRSRARGTSSRRTRARSSGRGSPAGWPASSARPVSA